MDITRREFCKTTAGLAGIIAAGAAPSLYAAGANDRVRVACVGYSDRFRYSLLPCFRHHCKELNFDLVAVADLWKKRLFENAKPELEKTLGHSVATYGSDVELYEKAKNVYGWADAAKTDWKVFFDAIPHEGTDAEHRTFYTNRYFEETK